MDHHATLNAWLRLFGERMGADLALDEEGACVFLCERDITMVIVVSGELFHLYGELVEFAQEPAVDTELLMRAMRLNQFQFMTGGANLLLGAAGQTIALGYSHPIEGMGPEDFCSLLGSFLDKCADMQDCLMENEVPPGREVPGGMHSYV